MAARNSQGKGLEPYTHEQVKELLEMVQRLDLEEVELEGENFKLRVVGKGKLPPMAPSSPEVPQLMLEAPAPAPAAPAPPAETSAAEDASKYNKVTSPMIGTFYRAPAPDSPSFVEVGDQVDDNTVLCIIEAMKLMNEIKAETRGIVRKILVENGQPVEYGQPMFLIEPQ